MKLTRILKRVTVFVFAINLMAFVAAAPVIFAQSVLADTTLETKVNDAKNLRLFLYQHTQNPQDKSIKFDLVINSQITSDRVQLTWFISDGPSQYLQIENQQIVQVKTIKQDITLESGKQYTFSQLLQPLNRGTTQLLVQVESYSASGRVLATVSKPVWTDASINALVLSEGKLVISNEYRLAQYLNYLRIFAIAGIIIVVIYYLAVWGYNWLTTWLKRD